MFKREIIDESILEQVEKNLVKNAFLKEAEESKKTFQVIELLSKAAQNFENKKLYAEAEALTRIIENISYQNKFAELEETVTVSDPELENEESFEEDHEEDDLYKFLMKDPEIAGKVTVSVDEPSEIEYDEDLSKLFE